jgi:hypothetical protein
MTEIQIQSVSGETLPVNVYVADYYGNNVTLVGTITSTVPPTQSFLVPSLFDSVGIIMIILQDANNCQKFALVPCEIFIAIRTQDFIPISSESGIILIP